MGNELFSVQFPDYEGVISSTDAGAYASIIERAFAVHLDREEIRKGLWKQYLAEDQVRQIKIKSERILALCEMLKDPNTSQGLHLAEEIRQECYDIINYAVFAARQSAGSVS